MMQTKNKTPKTFQEMTLVQLRQFIDGCHRRHERDSMFDEACREYNNRKDGE